MSKLTRRETEVLQLIAEGYTDKETGTELKIGERTVRRHLENARWKLDAYNRTHAVAQALRQKLIS